jgi:hypothetical protein
MTYKEASRGCGFSVRKLKKLARYGIIRYAYLKEDIIELLERLDTGRLSRLEREVLTKIPRC